MKKIFIMIGLIAMMGGCAHNNVAKVKQAKQIVRTGDRADSKLLGTRLGCAKMMVEYGYTEEACGDDWGKDLIIDWGNIE
jgi:hypothetical protein